MHLEFQHLPSMCAVKMAGSAVSPSKSFFGLDTSIPLLFTGCWVCFNNINHIQPSVLSVCTQLLQVYLDSLRANKPTIAFSQGEEVALNPNGACLATLDSKIEVPHMPKADKLLILDSAVGLLPTELSRQFRTVAVVNLDFRIAAEVMLLSQGWYLLIQ